MKILNTKAGVREYGIGYGSIVFYVDMGLGVTMDAVQLIDKLTSLGLNCGRWVVIRSPSPTEQGIASFVDGLKTCKVMVEAETDSGEKCPSWFMKVDRWIVHWKPNPIFNLGSMRPNRDMLLCKESQISEFIQSTTDVMALKGVLVKERTQEVLNKAGTYNLRVYQEVEEC